MKSIPKHIAVVMDGNGRWAQQQGLLRLAGHQAGLEAAQNFVVACVKKNIQVVTLFAFGHDNWQRPEHEVEALMGLLSTAFHRLIDKSSALADNNIQVRMIGDRTKLSVDLQNLITHVEGATAQHTGLVLVLAISYSGRWDITQAARYYMASLIEANKTAAIADVSQTELATFLALSDLPAPDLLIRTSGEQRISDFFLWQLAYTELYFTQTHWPDFDEEALNKALTFYAQCERRFGKTREQLLTHV